MKKIVLTLAIAFMGIFTAQAQVWLGGSLSANITKDSKTFSIAPDVGYCFKDSPFSIACAVEYGGTFIDGEGYSHALTLSPYFRYDICTLEERFSLFVDLTSDIDALHFRTFDIGLSPGVSFNVTEHWSAEFSYGFLGYRREALPRRPVENSFELDFKTATAEFGIYYNF